MESEVRYCKKCKCELSSYTKGKLCDNCRKRRNKTLKTVGIVILCVIFFPIGILVVVFNFKAVVEQIFKGRNK